MADEWELGSLGLFMLPDTFDQDIFLASGGLVYENFKMVISTVMEVIEAPICLLTM